MLLLRFTFGDFEDGFFYEGELYICFIVLGFVGLATANYFKYLFLTSLKLVALPKSS